MDDGRRQPPQDAKLGTDPTLLPQAIAGGAGETLPALATPPSSGAAATDLSDPLLGKTLAGRFTVLERLGAGGMSVVYLARHELLKKLVAVKLLRHEIASSSGSLARFHREAMAAAAIGNPHIVDVTDYFLEGAEAFLVMERLEGEDLRLLLRREGALAPGRAVAITRQILRALMAAHERGIVHRDLKAENVFICRRDGQDFVKLLDFGISKILQPIEGSGITAATGTGMVMGTPQYIAPEQAHGIADLDHRVDIYSLGVIVYEMLTGSVPFSGDSALAVVMKHVQEAPQPPRQRRPDLNISVGLEQLVLKAMAKDRQRRFQSAEEMLAALPDPLTLPGGFRSGPIPAPPLHQRRWQLLGLVAAALLAAGGAAVLLWPARSQRVSPPPQGAAERATAIPLRAPDLSPGPRTPDLAAAQVSVTIVAEPAQAEILVDDEPQGARGVLTRQVTSGRRLRIKVRAKGFVPQELELTPTASETRRVTLLRQHRPGPKKLPPGNTDENGLRPSPWR